MKHTIKWRLTDFHGPWLHSAKNLKFTGLTQNLGQL
jgi:hypothetical protein